MADPITLAIGVSAISKIFGSSKKRKAARLSRQADATRLRAVNIQRAAERKNVVRNALAARSGVIAEGVQSGVDIGSSTTQGAAGSTGSQARFGLNFLDTLTGLDNKAANLDIQANGKLSQASTFGAVGNLIDFGISQGVFGS
jgi:hypothetical protein